MAAYRKIIDFQPNKEKEAPNASFALIRATGKLHLYQDFVKNTVFKQFNLLITLFQMYIGARFRNKLLSSLNAIYHFVFTLALFLTNCRVSAKWCTILVQFGRKSI